MGSQGRCRVLIRVSVELRAKFPKMVSFERGTPKIHGIRRVGSRSQSGHQREFKETGVRVDRAFQISMIDGVCQFTGQTKRLRFKNAAFSLSGRHDLNVRPPAPKAHLKQPR